MTDKETVLAKHPRAECSDKPVKLFWPGQGERSKYIVVLAPHLSAVAGEGDTQELAWADAARRMKP